MNEEIVLDDLIKTEEKFDENTHGKLIANCIKDFVEYISPNGEIVYKKQFNLLGGAKKILVFSMVKKALFNKGVGSIKSEYLKPKEISTNKKLNIGSAVAQKVFNRELKGFFEKTSEGYCLPNYMLKQVDKYLKDED